MANYWVVGAFNDDGDQYDKFIRRGYWELDWADKDQPMLANKRDQIELGDRIAIKKMLGKGSENVEIRAIGIVKDIDKDEKRIYVKWILKDLSRIVPAHGFFSSIHGPYKHDDECIIAVFKL